MLPQDVLHHGGRGEREDRRRLRHSLSRPRGACPLRCARLGRFRLKWAAEFKLLRSPLMGADGFCFCVVVLWEGSGYNGGVGEVGALWPPRFLFFRLFTSLKIKKLWLVKWKYCHPFVSFPLFVFAVRLFLF